MVSDVIREYRPLRECTSTGSVSYGIVQPGSHVESGVPIIRVNNINDGSLDITSPLKVAPKIDEQHRKTRLEGGEVLLSLVGTTGQCVVAGPELKGWNVARAIAVIKPAQGINPEWLSICLKSPAAQHYLDSRANTTVQKTLNLQDVREIPIMTVSDAEERYILEWWNTLNDKIELNRRMNATLEGMAQALFKSWFVDFDPVIDNALAAGNPIPDELAARAEVRRQALANGTANRDAAKPFPAAFRETEQMGWIPEGWEVSPLGDILQQRVERVKPSPETAAIPYVPIECISPHSLFLENTKDGIEAQSSLTKFHKGDILFGAMRPYFHKVCIAPFDGTTRTTAFVLTCKDDSDRAFGAALVNEESTIDYATLHSEGSTIPYAKWKNSLERMPIILPPSGLRSEFGGKVAALLHAISPKFHQNVALTKLRDTLLPKLISGELRIPEAEQLTEEALA